MDGVKKVDVYSFDGFNVYVNRENGKSVSVPLSMIDRLDDFYNANDFFERRELSRENPSMRICINITSNCNLRCSYCFNKNKRDVRLSFDDSKKFIEDTILKNLNKEKYIIDLSGSGEPLLEISTIVKIAKYCELLSNKYLKDIIVQFICNGTLLTNSIVKILQKNNVLFGISLDGIKKDHDKNRVFPNGKGTFDVIMKNYNKIKFKDYVGAGMTFLPSDYPSIFDSYLFLSDNFQTYSCRIARIEELKEEEYHHIICEYERIKEFIICKIIDSDISFLKKLINGDDYFGRFIIKASCDAYIMNRCDAGINRIALGTDARTYICSSAVEIGLYEKIPDKYDECSECRILHICGGECMVKKVMSPKRDYYMCKLKEYFYKTSLEILGVMRIYYPSLYDEFISYVDDILSRQMVSPIIKSLSEFYKEKYTFNEIKHIYYHDEQKCNELISKMK